MGSPSGARPERQASILLGRDHLHSREDRLLWAAGLIKKAEVSSGKRAAVPTELAKRLKTLDGENRELPQANEILRKASAHFP